MIDLLAPMQAIARKDSVFFHGFPNTQPGTGHWNETGHATAGKLIAQMLTDVMKNTTSDQNTPKR